MDLTQLTVIILVLTASLGRGKIVTKASKQKQSMARVTELLDNIVTSCHKGRVNGVGLSGNLPSTLYKTLAVAHSIPTVLFTNVGEYIDYSPKPVPDKLKKPLKLFIVEARSYKKLYTIFRTIIRHTIWWNHMASVYILDVSRGCNDYRELLESAWSFDLLHALVLCMHHKSGRIMFSYNPFTSKAPVTWQKDSFIEAANGHPITVFSREYRENETIICDDIFFDKMVDLGGVPIKIKGYREDYSQKTTDTRGRGAYAFETRRRSILGTLFRHLNATVTFIDPVKGAWQTINAEPDGLQYSWLNDLKLTYPHRQVEANIITQFRGHKSQLTKILTVIDSDSQFGMGIVYLITLIFLKMFVHQTLVPALLNLVRMTCNTSFVNLPNTTASRIYIGCLLFFVVTMQGIFQGKLASRLTKYMPLQNVESIGDLEDLGYTQIYGKKYYKTIFDGTAIEKYFIVNEDERDCIMHVKNELYSAYIGRSESFIIDLVEEFKLHISQNPVEMIYVGFRIYDEWAMADRVNTMISRIVEANALELWEIKCKPIELSDFFVDPAVKSNVDFKNMELHELSFAFVILVIGLACATIILIIELAIGYKCIWEITTWRRGDTWEEKVVVVFPDNRHAQL